MGCAAAIAVPMGMRIFATVSAVDAAFAAAATVKNETSISISSFLLFEKTWAYQPLSAMMISPAAMIIVPMSASI